MTFLRSSDGKLTAFRRGTPEPNWSAFLAKVADENVRYVRAPVGDTTVSEQVQINRSNLHLDFTGSRMIVSAGPPLYQPFYIYGNVGSDYPHAVTTVTDSVDYLDVEDDLELIEVGQLHVLHIGVAVQDPNEPAYTLIRTVTGIVGNRVTYDRPFGVTPSVYASLDAFKLLTEYPEKVGDWGPQTEPVYGSQWLRGLGRDHGIQIFSKVAKHNLIENLNLEYTDTATKWSAWGVTIHFASKCSIRNMLCKNVRASAVHLYRAEFSTVKGLFLNGKGEHTPFGNNTTPYVSSALTSWGGMDSLIEDLHIRGIDIVLVNFESGFINLVFRRLSVSMTNSGVTSAPMFGSYGFGRVEFDDAEFINVPSASSILFPSYLVNVFFRNLKIPAATPDFFLWEGKGIFEEGFQWGSEVFGAPEEQEVVFLPVAPNSAIPYPEGILMEVEWEIQTRDGFSSFNITGGDPFQLNPGELIFSNTDSQNTIAFGVTYSSYRAGLANHRIYSSSPTPVTMRLTIMPRIVP